MLTFNSKGSAGPVKNVDVSLQGTSPETDIQCSPVRYPDNGESPQVVVMAMFKGVILTSPSLSCNIFFADLSASKQGLAIRVPLYGNKVIGPVD